MVRAVKGGTPLVDLLRCCDGGASRGVFREPRAGGLSVEIVRTTFLHTREGLARRSFVSPVKPRYVLSNSCFWVMPTPI